MEMKWGARVQTNKQTAHSHIERLKSAKSTDMARLKNYWLIQDYKETHQHTLEGWKVQNLMIWQDIGSYKNKVTRAKVKKCKLK